MSLNSCPNLKNVSGFKETLKYLVFTFIKLTGCLYINHNAHLHQIINYLYRYNLYFFIHLIKL